MGSPYWNNWSFAKFKKKKINWLNNHWHTTILHVAPHAHKVRHLSSWPCTCILMFAGFPRIHFYRSAAALKTWEKNVDELQDDCSEGKESPRRAFWQSGITLMQCSNRKTYLTLSLIISSKWSHYSGMCSGVINWPRWFLPDFYTGWC